MPVEVVRFHHPLLAVIALSSLFLVTPVAWCASELAPWVGYDLQGNPCEGSPKGVGPFDYRDAAHADTLELVEQYHFSRSIQALKKDKNLKSGSIPQNLDYVLRGFPNHHQALYSMARYALNGGKGPSLVTQPACYFNRAIQFAPDDAMVRLIFGIYLHRLGKTELARSRYEEALTLAPQSAEVHYNLGLLLVDSGDYKTAQEHARTAYKSGYPLPGLRNKLQEAGFPP